MNKYKNCFIPIGLVKKGLNTAVSVHTDDSGFCLLDKSGDTLSLKFSTNNLNTIRYFFEHKLKEFRNEIIWSDVSNFGRLSYNEFKELHKLLIHYDFESNLCHEAYEKDYLKNDHVSFENIFIIDQTEVKRYWNGLEKMSMKFRSFDKDTLENLLSDKSYHLFLYEEYGNLLAYILVSGLDGKIETAFVRDFFVITGESSRAGNQLMNFTLNNLTDLGFKNAIYWHDTDNFEIVPVMKSFGFKPSGHRTGIYIREGI